jgi:hypothetical protein
MRTTERHAAEAWAAGFQLILTSTVEKLLDADLSDYDYDSNVLRPIASPTLECDLCTTLYEGAHTLDELHALSDAGRGEACPGCEENHDGSGWVHSRPENNLPWGVLFAPRASLEIEWVLEHAGEIAALGFFVFQSEDFGCLLSIDSKGPTFWESHWRVLLRLRGRREHKTD